MRQAKGRYDEACDMLQDAARRGARVLGPDNVVVLTCRRNLALAYELAERFEEAEAEIRPVYERCHELLGPDHYLTLMSGMTLGGLVNRSGRCEEARGVLLDTLDGSQRQLGDGHPQTLETVLHLSRAHAVCGDRSAAAAVIEEALASVGEPDAAQRETVLALMNQLGELRMLAGRPEEAVVIPGAGREPHAGMARDPRRGPP